jgi:hypothetical protein
MFGSLGSRAMALDGRIARAVAGAASKGQSRARRMINAGMGMSGRRGTATAMAGSALGRASAFAARHPRGVAYGGAGAAGLGGIGMSNRRGSQNYPIY